MVKFDTDGCPWQMLPPFAGGIIIRRGNEPEQASTQLQGARRTEHLSSLIEKPDVKLDKRSGEGHIF
jgi:hypothetical protein